MLDLAWTVALDNHKSNLDTCRTLLLNKNLKACKSILLLLESNIKALEFIANE